MKGVSFVFQSKQTQKTVTYGIVIYSRLQTFKEKLVYSYENLFKIVLTNVDTSFKHRLTLHIQSSVQYFMDYKSV